MFFHHFCQCKNKRSTFQLWVAEHCAFLRSRNLLKISGKFGSHVRQGVILKYLRRRFLVQKYTKKTNINCRTVLFLQEVI